jgi:hypothetical protein
VHGGFAFVCRKEVLNIAVVRLPVPSLSALLYLKSYCVANACPALIETDAASVCCPEHGKAVDTRGTAVVPWWF